VLCSADAPSVLADLSTLVGSYEESTAPIAWFLEPELRFLHDVGRGSVSAMNAANYYERNLEVVCFVRHDDPMGCLVYGKVRPIALVGFFFVRCCSFNCF